MTAVDYEVEYNNRARVPEHPALISGWARDAAAYREQHPPQRLSYGAGSRNTIDIFHGGDGPIVVFIHGGYWQALDGSFFSHCARGLNAHGVTVAVPGYDLCPNVTVDDIIGEMRAACRELAKLRRPLVISGHSAGGHLAACMLATDWVALEPSLPKKAVAAAYAISGLTICAAGEDLDQYGVASRSGGGPCRKPAVLDAASRQPRHRSSAAARCGIFPARAAALSRRGAAPAWPPVRHHRRCQPFYRDRAARRSAIADGAAAEAAGRAVKSASAARGAQNLPLRTDALSLK
jgi:acetyl esterase/lipase